MVMIHELRNAFRSLKKSPGFAVAAVATLALGLGANISIFSIVNAVLLRAPAVRASDELVRIYTSTPEGMPFGSTSYQDYLELRGEADTFRGVVAYTLTIAALTGDGSPETVLGELVSGNYFELLGVEPHLGRAFLPEEDRTPATHPVVILGYGFWQRRFGSDPALVGAGIRLNGVSFDVVGIAPQEFRGLIPGLSADIWVPAMMAPVIQPDPPDMLTSRISRQFFLHARLAEGVGIEQAAARVDVLASRLETAYPQSSAGHTMTVVPASSVRLHPRIDRLLFPVAGLMLALVGLVLLIACTNLAGLLLARASDRRRDIAIRLALGASRRRIVGQVMAESLLLAIMGGSAGLLLASLVTEWLINFRPPLPIPISLDLGLDANVVIFTALLSLAAGVFFGLAPATQASNTELTRALKEDEIQWKSRRFSLRNVLLVGQMAVSMLLLVIAGLFVRSLQNAGSVDPGFDTRNSAIFTLNVGFRHRPAEGREFYRRLLERAGLLPGVRSAALADRLPLDLSQQSMRVMGERPLSSGEPFLSVDFARVSPGYFRTLGVPLVNGRDFADQDRQGAPRVAIVSQTMSRQFWPAGDQIGQRLRTEGGDEIEVIGVAGDTKVRSLGELDRPYMYVAFEQRYEAAMQLVLGTGGSGPADSNAALDPGTILAAGRALIKGIDPEIAPITVKTMPEHLSTALLPAQIAAGLVGGFGLLALLLAAVGIAGLMAYTVARRTREVGIRMALGASDIDVLRLVMGGGLRLVSVGVALGTLMALATTRLLSGFLVGVSPTDPLAFAGIILLLSAVAMIAGYIPARRAATADPMVVLRQK